MDQNAGDICARLYVWLMGDVVISQFKIWRFLSVDICYILLDVRITEK